jgi:hypothetical protein
MTLAPSFTRTLRAGKFAAATAACLFGLGAGAATPTVAADNPFSTLVGNWTGNGMVTYASGTKERLRCKVKYDQNAQDSIQQALRCASDSYKFQINAYYRHTDTTLTGHWDELTLQISGSITGSVSDGKISGDLHGPGFLASVLVDTKGNSQTVKISAEDQDIREVSLSVKRGN